MAPATAAEELPVGVGRVPEWWMELTPHHTLDLEEDQARKQAEAEMDWYYQQMAAAADAGALGPDGKPLLMDENGQPWTSASSNNWGGRGPGGGGADGGGPGGGAGGRNFRSGNFRIDPKMFGVDESDPDYQAYLTGAKLPPGFLEKMREMYGTPSAPDGVANNLAQTDYGRYGRQAENPSFQPAWMKKKLKKTSHGTSIRRGMAIESPSKSSRKLVQDAAEENPVATIAPPPLERKEETPVVEKVERASAPVVVEKKTEEPKKIAPPKKEEPMVEQEVGRETVSIEEITTADGQVKRVRKVRRVVRRKKVPLSEANKAAAEHKGLTEPPPPKQEATPTTTTASVVVTPERAPVPVPVPLPERTPLPESAPVKPTEGNKLQYTDFYYNAKPQKDQAPLQEDAGYTAEELAAYPDSEPESEDEDEEEEYHEGEGDYDEEGYYDEEVLDDEGYGEEYYEPEPAPVSSELSDLQAILAAKQAELARLQGL